MFVCVALTHPDLSEAALAQLELQSQGLPGDLPGIFSQPLGLRLDCRADRGQPVAKPVSVLCEDYNATLHPAATHTQIHTPT